MVTIVNLANIVMSMFLSPAPWPNFLTPDKRNVGPSIQICHQGRECWDEHSEAECQDRPGGICWSLWLDHSKVTSLQIINWFDQIMHGMLSYDPLIQSIGFKTSDDRTIQWSEESFDNLKMTIMFSAQVEKDLLINCWLIDWLIDCTLLIVDWFSGGGRSAHGEDENQEGERRPEPDLRGHDQHERLK